MKIAIEILNLLLDAMNLAMVQVFIATKCKLNYYTFLGRTMHRWELNDSLSFGKKTEMIDNVTWQWNDDIKPSKAGPFEGIFQEELI